MKYYDTVKYICGITITDGGQIGNDVGIDKTQLEFCQIEQDASNEKTCDLT